MDHNNLNGAIFLFPTFTSNLIPVEKQISASFCVVLSCVSRGLALGCSTVQPVLPKRIHRFRI